MRKEITSNHLYAKIAGLLHTARQTLVRAVNQTMIHTYYEIGRMIAEDEQHGERQVDIYLAALYDEMELLTENPEIGHRRDDIPKAIKAWSSKSMC